MQIQNFIQTMKDDSQIAVNRWIPDNTENIKAIVFLSHGMQEYALRYNEFGSFLAENGYLFNAHDHRGHGKTSKLAEENGTGLYGHLADKDGFEKVTSDLYEVFDKVRKDYPNKKIILFGHSFGSFVLNLYVLLFNGFLNSKQYACKPNRLRGL